MQDRWPISELERRVHRALARHRNKKVRSPLSERTIRYYGALGLLDPPALMEGRVALYGRRHLLQLVAIRRLQAEQGLSLVEIRDRLGNLSERKLETIAQVPRLGPDARRDQQEPLFGPESAEPGPPMLEQPEAEYDRGVTAGTGNVGVGPKGVLYGIPLGKKVVLLLEVARALGNDDLDALRVAAAPLLGIVTSRGLLAP